MATQVEVTGSAPGAIEHLEQLVKRFGLIAGSLVGLAGSIAALWALPPYLRWSVLTLAAGALLFVAIGKVVMPAIEARRRRKVIAIPEGSLRRPTTFRLRPYDETDHADFGRPDNMHHEALRWLERSSEPFLYLTGVSGTGKSSLLQAWLAPELAAGEPPTRTVVARSYADPIGQLVDALTRPGVIWDKRPSSTDDPRALLQRAAERVRPGRLLIAIDQFEECLVLQDEAGRGQLAELFRDLRKAPIPGLTFLLMLRDDYLDLDALRALGLPEVRSDGNWLKLNALSRGDARQLLDQRLRIDETLREKVLDEASEVDDLPGLVRPITLNMLGLVLQRFRGGALTDTAPGRLIQDYLRQAMAKPGIDQVAPRLLDRMITDKGTKRPIDEPSLADLTGVEPALVRKTLLLLAQEGVVRELEPERRVWEVSHDFVARQLGQIIPRLRPSAFHRVQRTMAPVALGAWLVLLAFLALAVPEEMSRYARSALTDRDVSVVWSEDLGGYRADFGVATPGTFDGLKGWLPWIRSLRELRIADDPDRQTIAFESALASLNQLEISNNDALQAIYGFGNLGALTQLTIHNNSRLQALPAWDGLGALTQLTISANSSLQALPAWDGLDALTQLSIDDNDGLHTLPDWDGLDALSELTIGDNDGLQALPAWDGLGALTQLTIDDNSRLQALPDWDGLGALTQLSINHNRFLQALPAWDGLGALTQLTIYANPSLQALPAWDGLDALSELTISANDVLHTLPHWDGLDALSELKISANYYLQALPDWDGLGALSRLSIVNNGSLQALPAWHGLGALSQLSIYNNSRLQALPAWDGLGALTQLSISSNSSLQAIEGLRQLSRLKEFRLGDQIVSTALAQVETLPMLERLMLPVGLEGVLFTRPEDLPPVEVRFVEPDSEEFREPWKPGGG